MTHKMTENCLGCGTCIPQTKCPTGAITVENEQYLINPELCNGCEGYVRHEHVGDRLKVKADFSSHSWERRSDKRNLRSTKVRCQNDKGR